MDKYRKMYITLFRETTKAIQMLQEAQLKIEEIYISDDSDDESLETQK